MHNSTTDDTQHKSVYVKLQSSVYKDKDSNASSLTDRMNKVCFMKVIDKQDGFSNQSPTCCTNLNLFYSTSFYGTKIFF